EELTLIHGLRQLSEGKPTGKPPTLMAVMINAALAGQYTSDVADGLRLHGWRDPQLKVIQKQLGEIDLPRAVIAAFRTERAIFQFQFEKLLGTPRDFFAR